MKGQGHDPNTLKVQYLENSWRCYLTTIADSLLWGSTVGYPSESLASCFYAVSEQLQRIAETA